MQIAGIIDGNFNHVELCGASCLLSCCSPVGGSGEPPLPFRNDFRSLSFVGLFYELIAKHPCEIGIVKDDHVRVVLLVIVVLPPFIPPAKADDAGPSI